jgi:hypothetical protein
MKPITVEVDDTLCLAYQDFSDENKQFFSQIVGRALRKVAYRERSSKLKKVIADMQSDPDCAFDPEILYMLIQGDAY